jgi:hypothetical protein
MIELTEQLDHVGDVLQTAWRRDHARSGRFVRLRRPRRLLLVLALFAAIVGGGAAVAADVLKSTEDEQQGMIEGYQLFDGSRPSCESLTSTSFRCTLEQPPIGMTFYDEHGHQLLDRFLGLKAETVDSTRHVDGACVSIRPDGRAWNCFVGDDAVKHGVLRAERLGIYQPETPTA